MSKIKIIFIVLGVLVAAALLIPRFIFTGTDMQVSIQPHHVTTVSRGDISQTISAAGDLEAADNKMHSFLQGGRIEEILVSDGETVEVGQELIQLDSSQQRLNLIRARNQYQNAVISGKESAIEEQEINLEIAERELRERTLTASIAGSVTDLDHIEGDLVSAGNPVLRIVDTSSYLASVNIDEGDSRLLELGQEVILEMDAFPGDSFFGSISRIKSTAVRDNGMIVVPVEISIRENRQGFRPGYSVDVEIVVSSALDTLFVPVTAIYQDEEQDFIMLVDEEYNAEPVPVETGLNDGVRVEIVSGLEEGDRVIINAYQFAGRPDDSFQFFFGPGGGPRSGNPGGGS